MKRIWLALVILLMISAYAFADANGLEQSFLEDGRLCQEDYLDDQGQLYIGEKGFARHVLVYDDENHVVREEYYGEDLQLVTIPDGYAVIERAFDDQDRVVWYRYLDAYEEPTEIKGIAELTQGYDENGTF